MSTGDGQTKRVCLLTGSAGLLGTHICSSFSRDYEVAAVYNRRPPNSASQNVSFVDPLDPDRKLAENDNPIYAIKADLANPGACERVAELALARFGRIDLVVNAAAASVWAPMLGSDRLQRSARLQLNMNVVVPFEIATAVARLFWEGRDDENRQMNRNVVNVSSVAGSRLYAASGQSVYAASKAALNMLSCHMAKEFVPIGIRVNACSPNSFPSIISVERVVSSIRALDQGTETGTIVIVDGEKDRSVTVPPYRQGAPEGYS